MLKSNNSKTLKRKLLKRKLLKHKTQKQCVNSKSKSKIKSLRSLCGGGGGSGRSGSGSGSGGSGRGGSGDRNNNTKKPISLIIFYGGIIIKNDIDLTGKSLNYNKEPNIVINNALPNRLYMVTMTDPDAPNGEENPNNNFVFTHWVYIQSQITKKKIIFIPYSPPTPPSGTHRYQFNLYDITTKTVNNVITKLTTNDLAILKINEEEMNKPDFRKTYNEKLVSFLQSFTPIFTIQYKVSNNVINTKLIKNITEQTEQSQQLQQQLQQKQKKIGFGTYFATGVGIQTLGNLLF